MEIDRDNLLEHPVKNLICINMILFPVLYVIACICSFLNGDGCDLSRILLMQTLFYAFILIPVMLFIYNVAYFFVSTESIAVNRGSITVEVITILYGAVCCYFYEALTGIRFFADWYVQIYENESHAPIFTEALPTVITIAAVAIVGYIILRLRRITKLPPLVAALSMGGIYLGMIESIVFMVQISNVMPFHLPYVFYLVTLLIIGVKLVRECVVYQSTADVDTSAFKSTFLRKLRELTANGANLPWLGALFVLPLLGVVVAVLILFGQAPDSIIRAWTETADWTFSTKIPPESLPLDTHYLCTVAAKGHRKVVKPLRIGYRHGHPVTVNRQLCVANAFEQLLSEKLPRLHRAIRRFYDNYGYPNARHIKSPLGADAVYFIMKPLAILFLVILYLFDEKPENRIAVQYPHRPLPSQT